MNLSVLIPARGGSERVAKKNITPFGETNLMEIKVRQMLRLGLPVYVSTECRKIAKVARDAGAQIIMRSPEYAASDMPMNEVYKHIAENFPDKIMLYANCTNPLLQDSDVVDAIFWYQQVLPDSLNSCHRVNQFLWQDGEPLNYDPNDQPRSQDLATVALNFAINIVERNFMSDTGRIVSCEPLLHEIHSVNGMDIDTPEDFLRAETLWRQRYAV